MTDPNNAAQTGLTDEEILQVFADAVGNQEDDARFIDVDRDQAIRIARTLLSKLRAPVADERAAKEYGSPTDVAQRIEQYLYHDGRKNSATQLLYEAMKALRALQGNRNDE